MARIRTIKPEFWSDGKVVDLSPAARLLFIGSWNFALCDEGHLPDDAMGLKLKVLPADSVDADEVLNELLKIGVLVRGTTVDGRSYLHVLRLRDHQKVDKRWTPRCFVCSQRLPGTPPNSPRLPETPARHSESPRNSTELTAVKERKGKEVKNLSDTSDEDADRFDEFWTQYPRKDAKAEARKAWRQITRTADPQAVIDGLAAYRFSPDRKFIPLPSSWLRGQRWEDEGASVHELRPADPHAGLVKFAEMAPGSWQECHPEGFYMGCRTEWHEPGWRPAQ